MLGISEVITTRIYMEIDKKTRSRIVGQVASIRWMQGSALFFFFLFFLPEMNRIVEILTETGPRYS